jgi:L-ribulose-5-phosphate 3-epimerase
MAFSVGALSRTPLDTANLILCGKGNPVNAPDVVGRYVRGIHAKDGFHPTDPKNLDKQVPVGQEKADFARIIQRLKELHYQGAITIEREISGPRQEEEMRRAKEYLESFIG